MNQLAKEKLQAIKSKLILEQPFFGNLALSRVYEEDVNVPFGSMGVTGKKLIYHPDFVLELRDDQLRGVLIHEILHLALDHLTRAKKTYIPMLWNIACDYAVNLMIQDIQGVSLPP